MNRSGLVLMLLALALLGVADSWYLAGSATSNTALSCDISGLSDCNLVAQSPYSRLWGIPLATYGLVFYAVLVVLGAAMLTLKSRSLPLILLIFTSIGAAASLIFLYVQFFLIEALCVYCLISAGIAFLTLGISRILWKWRNYVLPPVVE